MIIYYSYYLSEIDCIGWLVELFYYFLLYTFLKVDLKENEKKKNF